MANQTYKNLTFKLDNASGSLTAITSSLNQASLQGTQDVLDDSSLSDDERSHQPGLAGSSLSLNGFVNSTTDPIFGPLVGQRTSITKTFEYYNGVSYYTGEAYPTDVAYSGAVNDLITFSATLTLDGSVTKTSVAS